MKKTVSAILVLSMVVSLLTGGLGSFAASSSNDSEAMKQVLSQVKSKITVPEEYSEFDYSLQSRQGESYWIFSWSSADKGSVEICADSQGRIQSFYVYSYTDGKVSRAPTLNRKDAKVIADAFLKLVVPEISGKLSGEPTIQVNSGSQGYCFTYDRIENGLPCADQTVNVRVNYVTGQIDQMNVSWLYDLAYEKVENPVEPEKVKELWRTSTKMELRYQYDYSGLNTTGKTLKAYLAYLPSEDTKAVDAKTGELLEQEYEWVNSEEYKMSANQEAAAADTGAGGGNGRVNLTQAEIQKATEHDNLLTLAQADQKVRALTELSLNSSYKIAQSSLVANRYAHPVVYGEDDDISYLWRITYTGPVTEGESPSEISVCVDARTGELTQYVDYDAYAYAYRYDGKPAASTKAQFDEKKAKTAADSLLKKAAPSKYQNARFQEVTANQSYTADNSEVTGSWTISYGRTYQDIPVANDGLSISVSNFTGKVVNYYTNWEEKVSFESKEGIISGEAAVAAYVDNASPRLEYHIFSTYLYDQAKQEETSVSSDKAVSNAPGTGVDTKYSSILVYAFDSPSAAISAKTGKYIDSSGEEVTADQAFSGYQDISGHYAENEIGLLADIGVLPQRTNFGPNTAVKQKELLYYLYMSANSYRMYNGKGIDDPDVIDEIYETAKRTGVITDAEINREGAVTRYQAIRFLVRYMGFGELATDHTIFKVDFKDAASIPNEYLGSVAIGKSMKIIGGSNGSFNGIQQVSNGEAVKMIYNTLKCATAY